MSGGAILTLNAGSSSLKLGLYPQAGDGVLATGLVEKIGQDGRMRLKDGDGHPIHAAETGPADFADHKAALRTAIAAIETAFPERRIVAVGHRVVHGGANFSGPVVVDPTHLAAITRLVPLAPLHQPHNLEGIHAAMAEFPDAPQVACFDTAFHRGQPWVNEAFALPREMFDQGIRRYGFHGLSYDYISHELTRRDPELARGRVAVAHLGNGASVCAMRDGRSVASSMGFSTLDGLAMGTRCGQIDPGVLLYLMEAKGMDAAEIGKLLYHRSGLLGLSGLSNDMRELEAANTPEAEQAIGYFTHALRRQIANMAACLDGLDGLVFSGGIGENSPLIRARTCQGMGWMGVALDEAANAANRSVISAAGSRVKVMVIRTDEESVIAESVRKLTQN
ncbi:MAG: acetate/propionate family kinase [Paracoccus sp. (in: a-proteobacteria)]|uniref:acetate/propionate family kinase n=1 Tax=Paracoccus sp. TaxID=267 RepID=UPI0026DEEFD7|nr:acetate/propionate family kinase [Paracoccus sp. (in: a-proteobacteria)]MDO5620521.1 acetate/propionate family kinase [Paracoccus sp. (in: a-proteobacteria)]